MKYLVCFLAGVLFTLFIQWSGQCPAYLETQRQLAEKEVNSLERRITSLAQHEYYLRHKRN